MLNFLADVEDTMKYHVFKQSHQVLVSANTDL